MRPLSLFLILLGVAVAPPARAQQPIAGKFPFMAWDYVDNPRILKSMHEAGINAVAFVPARMLDDCHKFQLACIVFDTRLSGTQWSKPFDGSRFAKNLAILSHEVGNQPALYGYHVKDEPPESDFPELAKAVAAVKKLAPGKWPYINLFPGEGASYDKYLEDFVNIVHPTAISYDRYSVIGDVGSGDFDPTFWSNLAQVRTVALRHHLPFWNIILGSPHWRYRDLTPADLRLQVWGSLVYGARGISYYKFISKELPILNADDLGNWRGGPLNQFEEVTPTWYWLRDLNRQIQNIASVYLKLHSDDVYHFTQVPDANYGPRPTSLVKSIPEGDFAVGDFSDQAGMRYVLVVNKSLKRSAHCDPAFRNPPKAVLYVSPRTGEVRPYPAKYYWLAPGQGVLLELVEH